MNKRLLEQNQNKQLVGSNEVLKTTSLLYLKEALKNQEYEICAELVQEARNYGATQGEVSAVLKSDSLESEENDDSVYINSRF